MPYNKQQHFVPKFLLRNFSVKQQRKQIGIFNLPSGTFVGCGELRHQAYEDYFYGKDSDTDRALQKLENASAKIITRIISEKRIPLWNSEDYSTLVMFLLTTHSRTVEMTQQTQEMITKINRQMMLRIPQFEDIADKVKVELDDPVTLCLWKASLMHPLLSDLSCKLLINRTRTAPFMLSDHPVVLYNQFFERRKDLRGHTGYSSMGLEIYLPISPRFALFWYDNAIYNVRGKPYRPAQIDSRSDVDWLNALQYLNARENLYFDDTVREDLVSKMVSRFSRYRRVSKIKMEQESFKRDDRGLLEEVIRVHRNNIWCGADFSFVGPTETALSFRYSGGAVCVRNAPIVALHREFMRLVEKGQRTPEQFWEFVEGNSAMSTKNDSTPT